jgi:hypothetical protein
LVTESFWWSLKTSKRCQGCEKGGETLEIQFESESVLSYQCCLHDQCSQHQ